MTNEKKYYEVRFYTTTGTFSWYGYAKDEVAAKRTAKKISPENNHIRYSDGSLGKATIVDVVVGEVK